MKLPPLNALRAFEVAARHGGFIAAAEELCVTRGAVSRHVRLLEDHLGVLLFHRHARGVDLTDAGRRLQPVLAEAFGLIAGEAARLSARGTELRVICPPATSIRWLMPRIEAFRAANPDIRLRLTTDFFGAGGLDVSEFDLGFSVENWPGRPASVSARRLFPGLLSPACAPGVLEKTRLDAPGDLAGHRLLHETSDRADWRAWLERFPASDVDPDRGDVFPNLDLATRAAVMGAGIVMADLVLCREEIARGLLVLPFPEAIAASPQGHVCMIARDDRWQEPTLRRFAEWMEDAAEEDCRVLRG